MTLDVSCLHQSYGEHEILNDVSFSVQPGSVVTVLGPNGSGKSTLIRTICRILKPVSGTVSIDGRNVLDLTAREFSEAVGYVPQACAIDPYIKVFDAVLLGRASHAFWSYSESDFDGAAEAMETMSISDLMDRRVGELSGGQLQKVMIARAIAQSPRYMVLDEPTAALDVRNQHALLSEISSIASERGIGIFMSMHHIGPAMRVSDRILMLDNGRAYGFGRPEDVVTVESLRDLYGIEAELVEGRNGMYVHVVGECEGTSHKN